jgi:hypothetical protein
MVSYAEDDRKNDGKGGRKANEIRTLWLIWLVLFNKGTVSLGFHVCFPFGKMKAAARSLGAPADFMLRLGAPGSLISALRQRASVTLFQSAAA